MKSALGQVAVGVVTLVIGHLILQRYAKNSKECEC